MSRTKLQTGKHPENLQAADKAEEIRLRYLYRSMIQSGKIRLSLKGAVGLIGPDCAFHLYSTVGPGNNKRQGRKP